MVSQQIETLPVARQTELPNTIDAFLEEGAARGDHEFQRE